MSGAQTLRALVNERLAAAAEDIFVLIERTIAEYEEELCRYKQENQRKQQLLDKVPHQRVQLVRANVQIPVSPGPELKQEITETPQTKEEPEEPEEPSVKQEEEQLPVLVPEFIAVCVKTKESSLLQQRQTEHREETQGEDISSETHVHSETEGHTEHLADDDADWEQPSFAASKSPGLFPKYTSAPETSVHFGYISGADRGAERKYQCSFCNKSLGSKQDLVRHIRVHTGERPHSCTLCKKTFARKYTLDFHMRTHTGEKPYNCSICHKTYTNKSNLNMHMMKKHSDEKPYSCLICHTTFTDKTNLNSHMGTHGIETFQLYSL